MKLHYLIGDATLPVEKPAMIVHVCNDIGGWGKGFVIPLANRYPDARESYRKWYTLGTMKLGEIQIVQVTPDICVTNMIAQHDVRWHGSIPPIRYGALKKCLIAIYDDARRAKLTVHMPRIGCVLSGGEWPVIEKIILETMTVETFVYTLESQKDRWPTKYDNGYESVDSVRDRRLNLIERAQDQAKSEIEAMGNLPL
jgi:O-acetyl-ADP-ribose deacetylase (regulator of RNase III)